MSLHRSRLRIKEWGHIRHSGTLRDLELLHSRNRGKAGKQQTVSLFPTNKSQDGETQRAAGSLREGSVTSPSTNSRHCALIQPPCLPHHAQPGRSAPSQAEPGVTLAWGLCGLGLSLAVEMSMQECRVLGESRTTSHPGLTLCLPDERIGAGFLTERENLIQRAVVLKFFHDFSPLKC